LIKLRNSTGVELLRIHSDDTSNLFIGRNAGRVNVLDIGNGGYANTFTGSSAGYSNTKGFNNTASGANALYSNTTASWNTAIGTNSLYTQSFSNSNSPWFSSNVAIGTAALYSNQPTSVTNGISNTAVGISALYSNTTGNYNVACGVDALYSNNTGDDNIAIGLNALYFNASGNNNTAIGSGTLANNRGSQNTALGQGALFYNSGGLNNIAIGYNTGTHPAFPNLTNTIGIGNDGVYLHGASNQVILGNFSSVFIGGKVNWGIVSDGRIKKDVQEDVKGLDFISRLRPVTYHFSTQAMMAITGTKETPDFVGKYDGEKIKYSGFIAQEVEQAAKASGYEFSGYDTPKSEFGLYSIKYAEFVVPLVKAVQEQQAIIEQQGKKIIEQQQQYQDLLKRIEALEKKN